MLCSLLTHPHSSSFLLTPPHSSSLLLIPPHSSSLLTPPHSSGHVIRFPQGHCPHVICVCTVSVTSCVLRACDITLRVCDIMLLVCSVSNRYQQTARLTTRKIHINKNQLLSGCDKSKDLHKHLNMFKLVPFLIC